MKLNISTGLLLLAILTPTAAFAESNSNESEPPILDMENADSVKLRTGEGDPIAGETKSQLCQGCHGATGNSIETLIPKLAGQYSYYIAKELRNYQTGVRDHQIMNAMAATVSDDDLADIAAYFASQKKMSGNNASENPIGKHLFLKGDISRAITACVNCHGVNGKGRLPGTFMFPVIGGQHKDYLSKQITNFRQKDRTNSPSGVMNIITRLLSDEEIDALADYVSGL